MKIAYFVNEFPALSQTFVVHQIAGIVALGHDVHIYATHANKKSNSQLPSALREGNKVTYLHDYPANFFTRFVAIARNILFDNTINKLFILVKSLKYFPSCGLRAWLKIIERALLVIEQGKYDIVHCQFATLWKVVDPLIDLGVISGELVVSVRGYDVTIDEHTEDNVYGRLSKAASIFLPVSKSLERRLLDLGCEQHKIKVHYSGIKVNTIEPRKLKGCSNPIKLLSVGRLVEKKGFMYGISAVKQLVDKGWAVEYLILGDGPLRSGLEKIIYENDANSYVKLLGALNHDKAINLMRQSNILLAPCVTAADGDQEGIPNVIKEGMAIGVPVIATKHSGIPELIDDRESGLLVAEKDVEALANAIDIYFQMPLSTREKMIAMARNKVKTDYDIDKLVFELEAIYESLLN